MKQTLYKHCLVQAQQILGFQTIQLPRPIIKYQVQLNNVIDAIIDLNQKYKSIKVVETLIMHWSIIEKKKKYATVKQK